jgi:two-component system sensor histidine kinase VicK
LNESAGILGEKQRNFMHRVAANIQRLDSMIDSLVNITELDTGTYRLKPRPVDVVHLVEEAITNAALQFREKGLAVNLQIDDTLPRLPADEDSVRQIIGQLLTNAYLASPADSAITVTVDKREMRLQPDTAPRACLYVAVEDRGGGIMPEDVPRVFARKYRAENPLIDGLGDTGVGMSIAQTLVEAHEGHLWVESKMGHGTVFSFAIPLDLTLAVESD